MNFSEWLMLVMRGTSCNQGTFCSAISGTLERQSSFKRQGYATKQSRWMQIVFPRFVDDAQHAGSFGSVVTQAFINFADLEGDRRLSVRQTDYEMPGGGV